jgi:PAS domain S-box-containing protein
MVLTETVQINEILNNSLIGYFTCLKDFTIVKTNSTFANWLDIEREEIEMKLKWTDFLSLNSKVLLETHYLMLLSLQKNIKDMPIDFVNKNGSKFNTLTTMLPIVDKNNRVEGYQCLIIDITQRKKYEQQLLNAKIEAEELASKLDRSLKELKKFTKAVSHDLKSPLNNIIALANMLNAEYSHTLDEKGKYASSYIYESASKLKEMIDNMLSLYKREVQLIEETQSFHLQSLLDEIVRLLTTEDNVKITYPENPIYIKTNKTALHQILMNLISNAIKYNDSEKILITINFTEEKDHYVFSIKDNGRGIDEKNLKKIFEHGKIIGQKDRFGNSGTGIGLATVKETVEKLGGSIYATSVVGQGSEFIFSIKKTS